MARDILERGNMGGCPTPMQPCWLIGCSCMELGVGSEVTNVEGTWEGT